MKKTVRITALIFVLSIVGFGSLLHPPTAHATPSTYPITGYAWSENIGWVDLNCSNTVGLCSTSPFGLTVDPSGNITGYAWSENIGWISANPSDLTGCPQAPCTATITNGAMNGWMKVLSADGALSNPTIAYTPGTTTYNTAGTYTFNVPATVNSLTAALQGAGGSTTTTNNIAVTPLEPLSVVVGANGAASTLKRSGTTLATGSGAGGGGSATFASKVDYITDSNPESVALGDVNGDGNADVVIANIGVLAASVLLNNGNGTFAPKVDYTANDSHGIALADVNGDGKADMVITNHSANTASVLLNNGNGTFAPKVDYPTGTNPWIVALGDVNGDGSNDIAVTNSNSNTVSVLLNNGNGTFAPKVDYNTGAGPEGIALGDVNGDGKADIVVVNKGANLVSVLLNNGNGTFAVKKDYSTGSGPIRVALGDVNGDGKPDIVVSDYNTGSGNTVSVLLNNGNGTFAAKTDYTTGTGPDGIALSDVNGDGNADIVTGNAGASNTGNTVSVLLNNGNGTFAAKTDYTTGTGPRSIALGDVNGDGRPDIVVGDFTANTLSVLLNTTPTSVGSATLTYTATSSIPGTPSGWYGFISLSGTTSTSTYGITASGGVISGFSWSDDVMGWTDWHFASTTYGICTPSYSCSGNQITYTNSSCVTSNFGSMCVAPAFCSPGSSSCLYPNPSVTGALTLSPKLVPTGKTTQVSWNISNVQSCSVTGTNKDGTGNNATGLWNTLSGTKTSSAITGQTTYTLSCVPDDPAAPLFTQSATLNLVPTYREK